MPLPPGAPLFTISDVQAMLGPRFSGRRTRRWLDRAGLTERRHGTIIVSTDRLFTEFPELFRERSAR